MIFAPGVLRCAPTPKLEGGAAQNRESDWEFADAGQRVVARRDG
jgi:hypothetical protein